MLRPLFILVLLIHGLIHLMGFAKAFKLADVPQLGGAFSRFAGVMWLLAAVLFVASVLFFTLKKDWWWMPAAPAIVLSQILIFTQWHDAKFGTVANLIAVVVTLPACGNWGFNSMIKKELATLMSAPPAQNRVVTKDMLAALPPVIQKWLERSNVVGKDMIRSLHLRQTGAMRTAPGGKWMPVEAEQYFRADQPGFLWTADVEATPFVHLAGRDKYFEGHGHMLIKALSLLPVADAEGPETDQGTMLRYLAETCWFPTAALSEYIFWEQVDSVSAKATMRYGGVEASGLFTFTPEGDMLSFDALRYYDRKEGATLEKWHIEAAKDAYREFEDIRVMAKSSVSWQLKTGDFTWYRLEITDIEYNKP